MIAFEEKMTAERFDPFAHAAQAVAFASDGMLAIVFDDETALAVFGDEAQAAGRGARVANDVGDGFAEGERQGVSSGAERLAALVAAESKMRVTPAASRVRRAASISAPRPRAR